MNPGRYRLTLAVLLPAVLLAVVPASLDLLQFHRRAILDGELWRLFTGHWMHWSFSHLFWNCSLIAIAGALLEQHSRRQLVLSIVGSALLIGPILLWFEPDLSSYVGLSGIAAACVASLVTSRIRNREGPVWVWYAIGLLLIGKITFELFNPTPVFAAPGATAFQSVPLAHLVGALVGIGSAVARLPVPYPAEPVTGSTAV